MRRIRRIGMLVAAIFAVAAFSAPAASASSGTIQVIGGTSCPINPPLLANPGTTTLTNANTTFGPCSGGLGLSISSGSLDVTLNGSGVDGTAGPTVGSVTLRITIFGIPVCEVTIRRNITLVYIGGTPPTWEGTAVINNNGFQDGTDNSGFGCPRPQPYNVVISLT